MVPMNTEIPSPSHAADEAAAVAFGTPVRIAILRHLVHHPGSFAKELSQTLGLAQATISTNLSVLENYGLVEADIAFPRRKGRRVRWVADTARCRELVEHLQTQLITE